MSTQTLPLDRPAPRRARRHPRLRLPVEVRVGGRLYRAADWSVAGLAILRVDFEAEPGSELEIELSIPLRECRIAIALRASVRYHEHFRRRIGVEFRDVAPRQRAMLQFVVDEHLAGQILEADGVLEFAARQAGGNEAPPADAAPSARRLGRLARPGGALLVVLALLAAGLYRQLSGTGSSAAEAAATATLASAADGPTRARGDRLVTARPACGGPDIESLCD